MRVLLACLACLVLSVANAKLIALGVIPTCLSRVETRCLRASSICAPWVAVICTEGSCGYRFGIAYRVLTISTSTAMAYFRRL